jgi:hypothetical protein
VESGEFQIQIVHEKFKKDDAKARKKPPPEKAVVAANKSEKTSKVQLETQSDKPEETFPSFFCRLEKVRIKKNVTTPLQLIFYPLTMDQHKCYIIFTDPSVGEFQHEIVGNVELPNIIASLPPDRTLYVDTSYVANIPIPFKNDLMVKAR